MLESYYRFLTSFQAWQSHMSSILIYQDKNNRIHTEVQLKNNLPMQLTDVITICSIHRHEYLSRKFGRTDGSFSNRRSLFRISEPDTLA